jgi:hypothetical protein
VSKRRTRPTSSLARGPVRKLPDGRRIEVFDGPPVGPGVVVADVESVLAALQGFDPEMPWKKARSQVLPIMPRVRPYPTPELDMVRAMLPPGILVGFGIDLGPALTFITTGLLDRWRIDRASLAASALSNLGRAARQCSPDDVLHDQIAEVPVSIVQTGRGIAASLLLVSDHLERIVGAGDRFLVAPIRDILIALPVNVDREFAAWLANEWEALDPNHLHLGGFRYEAGRVSPEPIDVVARA